MDEDWKRQSGEQIDDWLGRFRASYEMRPLPSIRLRSGLHRLILGARRLSDF